MVDISNLTGTNTLQGLAEYTNMMTGGVLITGGIIAMFIIIILVLINRSGQAFENALAAASWSMFIVSMFFWLAHLLPTIVPLAFLLVAAFDSLYLYTQAKY